jgi:hypothetical protein
LSSRLRDGFTHTDTRFLAAIWVFLGDSAFGGVFSGVTCEVVLDSAAEHARSTVGMMKLRRSAA